MPWNHTGWRLLAVIGALVVGAKIYFGDAPSPATSASVDVANSQESIPSGEETMTTTTPTTGKVHHANEANFQDTVLNASGPVLVDFYADWCGPCKMITPVLEELAAENPQAKIVKVNVDNSPQLAAAFGVSSIPNLMVFENGRVSNQQVGLANKNQLKSMLGL